MWQVEVLPIQASEDEKAGNPNDRKNSSCTQMGAAQPGAAEKKGCRITRCGNNWVRQLWVRLQLGESTGGCGNDCRRRRQGALTTGFGHNLLLLKLHSALRFLWFKLLSLPISFSTLHYTSALFAFRPKYSGVCLPLVNALKCTEMCSCLHL